MLEITKLGAFRWLQSLDLVRGSVTYGFADRDFWAWKTKDFANGTWQGGLAGLLDAAPLTRLKPAELGQIVEASLSGTGKVQRSNGSFEEAYPWESSYAVTGLVLFDLLYAYLRYPSLFSARALVDLERVTLAALGFLDRTPETHGVIANHLATGEVARLFAQKFLKLPLNREPLAALLALQHAEGWFPEYGGADPGYQSLLNHYLFAGWLAMPELTEIGPALQRSLAFLSHFAFSDGSFAGEVGSRGTAILYPSGAWAIEGETPKANALTAWATEAYLVRPSTVSPATVDSGNFVPVFNSWALHWRLASELGAASSESLPVGENTLVRFPAARLVVVGRSRAQVAVSLRNGAIRRCVKGEAGINDGSLVAFHEPSGATTQLQEARVLENTAAHITLELPLSFRNQPQNTPFRSTLLRLAGFIFYQVPFLQRAMKLALAKFVMRRSGKGFSSTVTLTLDLEDERLEPRWTSPNEKLTASRFGFLVHMASANSFDSRAL